jgi:hypothetical protein
MFAPELRAKLEAGTATSAELAQGLLDVERHINLLTRTRRPTPVSKLSAGKQKEEKPPTTSKTSSRRPK